MPEYEECKRKSRWQSVPLFTGGPRPMMAEWTICRLGTVVLISDQTLHSLDSMQVSRDTFTFV